MIAGTFAVIGLYWWAVTAMLVFGVGWRSGWMMYGMHAPAALAVGALMVAHAPLRPWREPAVAGALAVALMWMRQLGGEHEAFSWLQPWPVALGVVAMSSALAAAGGLAARRFAAAARTGLIIALSVGVGGGVFAVVVWVMDFEILSVLLGVLGGGFVTQAVVASRRPVACGVGGAAFVAFPSSGEGGAVVFWSLLIILPILVLIGYLGAALAWRTLRHGDASSPPDVPPARLG